MQLDGLPMTATADPDIAAIRASSRRLVRELGFLRETLAGTDLSASAVHAILEIGARGTMTAADLCAHLALEKSTVSRMLAKLVAAGLAAEGADDRDGRAKPLSLTPEGARTAARIDAFATGQAAEALARLDREARRAVAQGLRLYADALGAARRGGPAPVAAVEVVAGYAPGALGRCAELHGAHYAAVAGFGGAFEAIVAAGLAEFAPRLDRPRNGFWRAVDGGATVGTIAIDGEDLGEGVAHLRWFIVEDRLRGTGVGRRLLSAALAFCDAQGFAATRLWTFRGLDAARRLYEQQGFVLAAERPGRQWGGEVLEQRFDRSAP